MPLRWRFDSILTECLPGCSHDSPIGGVARWYALMIIVLGGCRWMHNLVPGNKAREQIAANDLSRSTRGGSAANLASMHSDNPDTYVRSAEQAMQRQQYAEAARHVDRALRS